MKHRYFTPVIIIEIAFVVWFAVLGYEYCGSGCGGNSYFPFAWIFALFSSGDQSLTGCPAVCVEGPAAHPYFHIAMDILVLTLIVFVIRNFSWKKLVGLTMILLSIWLLFPIWVLIFHIPYYFIWAKWFH